MRVLLTGAGGMVGRNIVDLAERQGIELLTPPRQELDLCDSGATFAYMANNKPDLVVHAAGTVGGIQANIKQPVKFLIENYEMGKNLVLAARATGVERLINLGSSCMYPSGHDEPLREEQVLTGALEPTNEGYAIAKCAVARLCTYVRSETPECQYKTLIPCNIYGKYDHFEPQRSHLVPAIIAKLHAAMADGHTTVEIWGDGSARREFMWAGDLADVVMEAMRRFEALPDIMNVGIGHDYSINEYYEIGASVVGYKGRFVHDLSRPTGMKRKLVDTTRLQDWGWRAKTSLESGLRLTYDYYLNLETYN